MKKMKKLALLITIFIFSFAVAGCFTESTTIKFVKAPNSLYRVGYDIDKIKNTVTISIDGVVKTLAEAERDFGSDISVTGLNLSSEGTRTLVVKYLSATIYFEYKVVADNVNVPSVNPDTTWYDDEKDEFVIDSPEELYGFAELVNRKVDPKDFAGKTVKLGADIDLTDYVWIPIGEGVRKGLKPSTPNADMAAAIAELNDNFTLYDHQDPDSGLYLDKAGNELPENYALIINTANDLVGFVQYDAVAGKWTAYQNEGVNDSVTESVFKGTFDGQNHTIKGLSDIGYNPQDVSYYYTNSFTLVKGYVFGLFGRATGDVTIKNLKMTDVAISGKYYNGSEFVSNFLDSAGAVLGFYQGLDTGSITIENCEVLTGSVSGSDAVGGVIGRIYNAKNFNFKNIKNYVTVNADIKVGGILGYMSANKLVSPNIKFENCANYGNVTSSSHAGGIASYFGQQSGETFNVTLINVVNYGNVKTNYSKSSSFVGGIVANDRLFNNYISATNTNSYGSLYHRDALIPNQGVPVND